MVDDLTQESFQTGKAVVTVSVDIINAIADACRESERTKKLTAMQKDVFVNRKFPHILTEFSPRGKKLLFFKPSLCFH